MRKTDVLRLTGAAFFATASLLAFSTSANAWAGLSEKQQAHIEEFIRCNTLMWTDIAQFEAEQPPCGGTPSADLKSMGASGGNPGYKRMDPPNECEWPSGTVNALVEVSPCTPQ